MRNSNPIQIKEKKQRGQLAGEHAQKANRQPVRHPMIAFDLANDYSSAVRKLAHRGVLNPTVAQVAGVIYNDAGADKEVSTQIDRLSAVTLHALKTRIAEVTQVNPLRGVHLAKGAAGPLTEIVTELLRDPQFEAHPLVQERALETVADVAAFLALYLRKRAREFPDLSRRVAERLGSWPCLVVPSKECFDSLHEYLGFLRVGVKSGGLGQIMKGRGKKVKIHGTKINSLASQAAHEMQQMVSKIVRYHRTAGKSQAGQWIKKVRLLPAVLDRGSAKKWADLAWEMLSWQADGKPEELPAFADLARRARKSAKSWRSLAAEEFKESFIKLTSPRVLPANSRINGEDRKG